MAAADHAMVELKEKVLSAYDQYEKGSTSTALAELTVGTSVALARAIRDVSFATTLEVLTR